VRTPALRACEERTHGSIAKCKSAEIVLDTDLAGRPDAFNPAELLLAALAACMIKGIERVAPLLRFEYGGVEVSLVPGRTRHRVCRGSNMTSQSRRKKQTTDWHFLHENVRKLGTVFNTVAPGTELTGVLRRSTRPNTYVAAEQDPPGTGVK
jgi:uncharacterized OsmC-like protein